MRAAGYLLQPSALGVRMDASEVPVRMAIRNIQAGKAAEGASDG